MVKYTMPVSWTKYDIGAVVQQLMVARAAMLSLSQIPMQRNWADEMQKVQLKREVAGTSRIEGAEFTDKELDAAMTVTPEQLQTRSQRQAAAAKRTYEWIGGLQSDRPVDADLIKEVHRMIVTGADDDRCEPGVLRGRDVNVTFGAPPHRGAEGGEECAQAFAGLCYALEHEFRRHDPLVQAIALHYHFAAIHPFLDGNGRTARALEALMLQRVGLPGMLFIAMSNYYYENKPAYLETLATTRAGGHDLTPFLLFGLRGIEMQCSRMFAEVRKNVSRALFRNMMFDLYNRLRSTRKRVIAERQVEILKLLLNVDSMMLDELEERTRLCYVKLGTPHKAFIRDVNYLLRLRAIGFRREAEKYEMFARLEWPTEITETEFFRSVKEMPKAKTPGFLA
jgi:Fic family protein